MKYNNFVFWWKADSDRYGKHFRKWWRFRRAYKEGVFDFYSSTFLVIGSFTLLYGLYRGSKKRGNHSYQEKVNAIKLEELNIEMEKLQLQIKIDELEQ